MSGRFLGFWVFLLGFILRGLPELLSGPYPVGFDVLAGYVPAVMALPDVSPMRLFGWAWSPLALVLLWFIRLLTGVDVYLLMKVAGPVFYGLFVASFYYMVLKGLGWGVKKSFFVALIFLLQPAVLRTGWDQFREELGLVFFFLLLAKTKCDVVGSARSKSLTVLAFSLLIVFSHQLVTILLLVVVLWQLVDPLMKRQGSFWKSFVVFVPAAFVFVWQLYSQFVNPGFSSHFAPIQLPNGTGNFIFTNYFLSDPRFLDGDYWKVLSYVTSLSLYVVVPLVPIAWKGFSKDKVFTPILVWLCAASYGIVVYPAYAFSNYWWWTLLLPVPLTVYFGKGLENPRIFSNTKLFKTAAAVSVLLGLLAFGYATSNIRIGYFHSNSYIPSGLVESSISFGDIPNIRNAMEWINDNVPLNSQVIVQEKFHGLAFIFLRRDLRILVAPALMNLSTAINIISSSEHSAYALYYIDDIGNNTSIEALVTTDRLGVWYINLIK
ncbi:MAG TPA: hypothetical protein VJ249_10060 [Candidatus Bathyarchaeia archaeon]|nr:hypothetical protein [Candidatus Bathyarchaeia archaeon]